jgi:hypothetical protein
MSLHSWLKSLQQSSRRRNRKSSGHSARLKKQRRMFVEPLEDRRLLAALSIGDASVTEGDSLTTVLSFPVTLSQPVDVNVSVDYVTQDGTATTADNDYVGVTTPATFTLLAGETTGTIDITVNGDTTIELDETLSLIFSNLQASGRDVQVDGAVPGAPTFLDFAAGGGTLPDGTTYSITGSNFAADGNGFHFDGGNVDITFSNPVSFQVLPAQGSSGYWNNPADGIQAIDVIGGTVSLTTDPDDEIAATSGDGTDHLEITFRYTGPGGVDGPINGNNHLPAFQDWIIDGSTTSTLTITDTTVTPTNTSGFAVAVLPIIATAAGTITNDDSATLSIGDASVTEDDSLTTVLSFPVTLSQPVDVNVSVDYVTQDGTATTADNDYVSVTTPATFTLLAGDTTGTIDITVNGDTTIELDETLSVLLSNMQASGRDVSLVGTSTVGAGIVQLDASTLGLTNGVVVSSWGGQTAAGTPTYLDGQTPNGGAAVQFNSGGDRMGDNVPVAASAAGDWITVAVVKANSIGAYHNLVDDDASNRPMLWIDPSFNYEMNFGGGGAKGVGTGTGGWDIVIADSRLNQLYVNSPTPNATGGGAVAFNVGEPFDFFHRDGGQTFQGLVAELMRLGTQYFAAAFRETAVVRQHVDCAG